MSPGAVEISVVIPAYNEAQRISLSLERIGAYFNNEQSSVEIVVVDDGSSDQTVDVIKETAAKDPRVRLVRNDRNRGKGFSVRHGVLEARGEIVLFSDADLSSPIEESKKILDPIRQGLLDLAIGSRALDRSLIGVRQSWLREQSGKVFNAFVRTILHLPYSDTQCGFKAFRRHLMIPVFERQRIFGFGFDPEMLYLARLRGLRAGEIPVRWNHVQGSKVHFLSDAISMFFDLVRIRWNHLSGKYRWEE
ncbi:MAG: glycosyltransferase family 2 protein [Acidobacteriia bacterium]|nr:glycosyltransferase family 2 protein [Terriglobia bacterium]